MRPKLLDCFSGAGGAAFGYYMAGFDVTGVDIKYQQRYPSFREKEHSKHFTFIQADALEYLAEHGHEFDAIHASPPCQFFSVATPEELRTNHVDLITPTRKLLIDIARPYVIENVEGARAMMVGPTMLCGTMFGLGVFRHRLFETCFLVLSIDHEKHNGFIGDGKYFSVAGGSGRWKTWGVVKRNVSKGTVAQWREAMGIDWMIRRELTQAIPPAYTEFIGRQLMNYITAAMEEMR